MRRLAAAALVVVGMLACNSANGPVRSSGTLAASNDSQYLYAADGDNGLLLVVDAKTLEKVAQVQVGARPSRVVVGKDDTIFVANRGSRSVSAVRKGDWSVIGTASTGVDPLGMQVSSDGSVLYVVSATAVDTTDYGILSAIDTATLAVKWELPVGDEPRGLALINDSTALISLYKTGELVHVDLAKQQVVESGHQIDIYNGINRSALATVSQDPSRQTAGSVPTFHARGMTDIAVTPDGSRAFAATQLSREAPILTQPTPDTPYYKGQGPRLAGSVSTPAVITLDTTQAHITANLDDVGGGGYAYGYGYGSYSNNNETGANYPQTSFAVSGYTDSAILQGTTALVVDMTGQWLFMVNRDSKNVSVVAADKRNAREQTQPSGCCVDYAASELPSVHSTANVGNGADGLAVLGDNRTVFVYNQFDHTVQRLEMKNNLLTVTRTSSALAPEKLDSLSIVGRKLFHDATDRRISAAQASVACSSCHLEGRDDGHTWQFPDGPRQTPTLAGRGMQNTAPYHWSGEFPDLKAFLDHTIVARMGGTGLQGQMQDQMNAYVDTLPAPENPFKTTALNPQQSRGAAVFQRAACGSCHSGQWLTNNTNADVGTLDTYGVNPDNGIVMNEGLNVPSLRGLARSGPYLHDGSATTLKERLLRDQTSNKHGTTSDLSNQDMDDLVAYLKTL